MSENFTRRDFLLRGGAAAATLYAGGAVADVAARAQAASLSQHLFPMTVQLPWLENVQSAGEFIADHAGIYKREGLAVKLLTGGPNVTAEPEVVQGKATVGITSPDLVARARLAGAPLKIIGAGYQKNPYCVISPAATPIKNPQGLVGKTIGVSTSNLTAYESMLKLNNINPSSVTRVPVQFDPTPLADGEVDAWLGYFTNEPITLELKGFKVHTFLLADFGYHVWSGVYEVTEATIAQHKSELVSFMRAERTGWHRDIQDLKLGADLAVRKYGKNLKLNMHQQMLESEAQAKLLVSPATRQHGLLWMSKTGIEQNLAALKIAGVTANKDLFDLSILHTLAQENRHHKS